MPAYKEDPFQTFSSHQTLVVDAFNHADFIRVDQGDPEFNNTPIQSVRGFFDFLFGAVYAGPPTSWLNDPMTTVIQIAVNPMLAEPTLVMTKIVGP